MSDDRAAPVLSVVLINYNLDRELPRTLFTLSAAYQRDVRAEDYEVLVVDNGSRRPPTAEALAAYGPNFHLVPLDHPLPSPVRAINAGAAQACGKVIAIMIDGARMLSPGVIRATLDAARLSERAIIAVPNWHLGPDVQHKSIVNGYNQEVEDQLMDTVDWRADGYELFRIAVPAPATRFGIFRSPSETCFLGLSRDLWEELGGFDLQFDLPGGGLVNRDCLKRALSAPRTRFFLLFGEGTFHQHHGGISTGASGAKLEAEMQIYSDQYQRMRNTPWERLEREPEFLGRAPAQVMPEVEASADRYYSKSYSAPAWRRIHFARLAWHALRAAIVGHAAALPGAVLRQNPERSNGRR